MSLLQAVPSMTEILFRWLGVAGVELRASGEVLVMDPFVTRVEPWRALGRVRSNSQLVARLFPRCDHVFVTHAHYDHLLDVPEVIRATGAHAYGSANTCRLLEVCGVPADHIHRIIAGDRLMLGRFRVEVLPAQHLTLLGRPILRGRLRRRLRPPLRPWHYRMDDSFSFLIEVNGHRILNWASERPDGAPSADVLMMRPYATPGACERLLQSVQPRLVIPVHWDSFVRPLSRPVRPMINPRLRPPRVWPGRLDLTEFRRSVEAVFPNAQILELEVLATYPLVGLSARPPHTQR